MSATIDDVAKKAAVSTATVSRALRGLPNVAEPTRAHVLKVAKELNYVIQSQSARALSGNKVVAIIRPLVDQWFYSKLSTSAELELRAAGYQVVHHAVDNSQEQSVLITDLLSHKSIDAIISISFPIEAETQKYLDLHRTPIITIEAKSGKLTRIYIDNKAAAELATRHLINLGHKRIGLILGSHHNTEQNSIPAARRAGYRLALAKAGLKQDPALEVSGNDVYRGGAQAMMQLLNSEKPPSAIFAITDEMAIGALKALRDMNLRAPEHISIIGFDDNDVSEFIGLTTIRQPLSGFAEQATKLLIKKIASISNKIEDVKLDYSLIIRKTTGPLNKL